MAALGHGSEVAVWGGGVAGHAFASALLASAQMRGLRLGVRVYEPAEPGAALGPAVVGPLTRHRLAAVGVALPPEACALELRGLLVSAAGQSALLPAEPGSTWVVDGWPSRPPGQVQLGRLLAQAAAARGARCLARPLDAVESGPAYLALRSGGAPARADLLCLARADAPPLLGLEAPPPPRRWAVRARLFAPGRSGAQLGNLVRLFVAPTPAVRLLLAVPAPGSLHLTAVGPQVAASDLALAVAELVRAGALPAGLEVAELARAPVGWGPARLGRHGRLVAVGEALAAHPLDPLHPALEQAQRAALAVVESAGQLAELPGRAAALLGPSRQEVASAVRAAERLSRAGAWGPGALARLVGGGGAGLVHGLGPTPQRAARALWGPSVAWPLWEGLRPSAAPVAPALPPARPVYVVDDDPAQRALVCEYLAARQVPVRAFSDELTLLAAAEEEPPRAVVLDLVLNLVDGIRLCRALKSHPATRAAPVFVVSGLDRPSDRRAALGAGAAAFLPKPVDLEALFGLLCGLREAAA